MEYLLRNSFFVPSIPVLRVGCRETRHPSIHTIRQDDDVFSKYPILVKTLIILALASHLNAPPIALWLLSLHLYPFLTAKIQHRKMGMWLIVTYCELIYLNNWKWIRKNIISANWCLNQYTYSHTHILRYSVMYFWV